MSKLSVLIEFDPKTKSYGATSPDLPDVFAVSDNRDDVLNRFIRAATGHLKFLRERNCPLPKFDAKQEIVTIEISPE
ncbi:MAG TPA: hypothetical protein VGR69_06000 [Candidatus Rubrimentiphilum sp.]|nr:hypothetical protein [Candidatus Rubrimentiphilum sp.]